jgi:hypothetical protein
MAFAKDPSAQFSRVPLYESDFYAWTQEQVSLLRQSAWERLDILNLIEEVDSLGRQERQELRNRLGVLLGHLLKWQFQPEARSKSWRATLREQRRRVIDLLAESPSLKPYLIEAITKAYEDGLDLVVQETPLDYAALPEKCPYENNNILDLSFFPGASQTSDL